MSSAETCRGEVITRRSMMMCASKERGKGTQRAVTSSVIYNLDFSCLPASRLAHGLVRGSLNSLFTVGANPRPKEKTTLLRVLAGVAEFACVITSSSLWCERSLLLVPDFFLDHNNWEEKL